MEHPHYADGTSTVVTTGRTGAGFVAGTLVHTMNGLAPIENIRMGDMVLSQPEQTGERACRPVTSTFVFDDNEVYLLDYCVTGDSAEEIDPVEFWADKDDSTLSHLVVTANHPFWVKTVGWTGADFLEPNQVLELHDGSSAVVLDVRKVLKSVHKDIGWTPDMDEDFSTRIDLQNKQVVIGNYAYESIEEVDANRKLMESGDPYLKQRVYNFEVDAFHTYYVGEQGVWVHNTGCQDIAPTALPAATAG